MVRTTLIAGLLCMFATAVQGGEPARPGESDFDFLLSKSSHPAAATRPVIPTTRPVRIASKENPEARKGVLVLSNGEKIRGMLSTTREKPIRIWDDKAQKYRDIPFDMIKSMEAKVLWERDQPEWHFKESGSDIKEFTGKTYPARELQYVVTLINDQKITGGIVCPLYAESGDQSLTFVIYKRQKGDVGKPLKQLVYVKKVELED